MRRRTAPHCTVPTVSLHSPAPVSVLWTFFTDENPVTPSSQVSCPCLILLSARLFLFIYFFPLGKPPPLSSVTVVFLRVWDAAGACHLLTCPSFCLSSHLSADTTVSSQKGKTPQLSTLLLPCVCLCVCARTCLPTYPTGDVLAVTRSPTRGPEGQAGMFFRSPLEPASNPVHFKSQSFW